MLYLLLEIFPVFATVYSRVGLCWTFHCLIQYNLSESLMVINAGPGDVITYSLLCLFCRAIYRRADVYLLDDPLSAVDTVVGRRLFETCLKGVLSSSVVVLVTHQLQYAQLADTMLVVDQVGLTATIYV